MLTAFSRVLWFLRLALLLAVVVGAAWLVILDRQPGNRELTGYVGLFGFYWLPIAISLDAVVQILVAIAAALHSKWAALWGLLLGLLVDVCIALIFVGYIRFLR